MNLDYTRGRIDSTVYLHLLDPRKVTDLDTLTDYDRWATDHLRRLEAAIETIKQYRMDLMERAQYLVTVPSTWSIELHRRRTYRGKVEFYLQQIRTYPDGTQHTEQCTKYPGTQRHKALADYKAACKSHPGAPYVLDIATFWISQRALVSADPKGSLTEI